MAKKLGLPRDPRDVAAWVEQMEGNSAADEQKPADAPHEASVSSLLEVGHSYQVSGVGVDTAWKRAQPLHGLVVVASEDGSTVEGPVAGAGQPLPLARATTAPRMEYRRVPGSVYRWRGVAKPEDSGWPGLAEPERTPEQPAEAEPPQAAPREEQPAAPPRLVSKHEALAELLLGHAGSGKAFERQVALDLERAAGPKAGGELGLPGLQRDALGLLTDTVLSLRLHAVRRQALAKLVRECRPGAHSEFLGCDDATYSRVMAAVQTVARTWDDFQRRLDFLLSSRVSAGMPREVGDLLRGEYRPSVGPGYTPVWAWQASQREERVRPRMYLHLLQEEAPACQRFSDRFSELFADRGRPGIRPPDPAGRAAHRALLDWAALRALLPLPGALKDRYLPTGA